MIEVIVLVQWGGEWAEADGEYLSADEIHRALQGVQGWMFEPLIHYST